MNRRGQEMLTTNQVLWITFAMLPIGTSIFPRTMNQYAGQSGWIFVLFSTLLILLISRLLLMMVLKYPGLNFLEILQHVIGKWPANLITFLSIFVLILYTGIGVRGFANELIVYLLPYTPTTVIIIPALLVLLYTINKGIGTIARLNEIVQPILLIGFIALGLLVINKADFSNLLPILPEKISFFDAGLYSFYPFLLLIFLLPYLFTHFPTKKGMWKGIAGGTSLISFTFIWLLVISISLFGTVELHYIEFPGIDLARMIMFPFLERMEIVYMVIWIPVALTLHTVTAYICSEVLNQLFPCWSFQVWSFISIGLIGIVALLPDDIEQLIDFSQYLLLYSIVSWVLFVPFLVLWDAWKNKRRSPN